MAKASKKKQPAKKAPKEVKRGSYDNKLSVTGSFMDIIKASVKDATNHSAKKKD
jgi:hypothetical protein